MNKITIITLLLICSKLMASVSVGSSPGFGTCTYLTIQEAIDSGENEIRVLNNQDFIENLTINRSVIIKGGYTNLILSNLVMFVLTRIFTYEPE